jgi:hypothetical protein
LANKLFFNKPILYWKITILNPSCPSLKEQHGSEKFCFYLFIESFSDLTHSINLSFFDFFRFMPWHKSDAIKGYFFAFRPGLNRNIFVKPSHNIRKYAWGFTVNMPHTSARAYTFTRAVTGISNNYFALSCSVVLNKPNRRWIATQCDLQFYTQHTAIKRTW